MNTGAEFGLAILYFYPFLCLRCVTHHLWRFKDLEVIEVIEITHGVSFLH